MFTEALKKPETYAFENSSASSQSPKGDEEIKEINVVQVTETSLEDKPGNGVTKKDEETVADTRPPVPGLNVIDVAEILKQKAEADGTRNTNLSMANSKQDLSQTKRKGYIHASHIRDRVK